MNSLWKATRFKFLLRRSYAIVQGIDEEYVNSPEYKKEIKEARIRIFGHAFDNNMRSGHKLLKKPLVGERLVKWYPMPIQVLDERFQDPRTEPRQEKLARLKKKGKIRPRLKGQGKPSSAKGAKGKKK